VKTARNNGISEFNLSVLRITSAIPISMYHVICHLRIYFRRILRKANFHMLNNVNHTIWNGRFASGPHNQQHYSLHNN